MGSALQGSVTGSIWSLTPEPMDALTIAGKSFASRLIVGTGKYSSPTVMLQAHEASGAEWSPSRCGA